MRPNSTIHMSSGCPFTDVCPCAPHHYFQRPRSPSQICTLLPILLKTAEKLTANPVLSKRSPFAKPPVQPQWPSHDRRSQAQSRAAGQTPGSSNAVARAPRLPRAGLPRPCRQPVLPCGDFCQPGTHAVLSSLPPSPQPPMRSFTSYFACHCLKYTRWIRCYFFCLC